MEALYQLLNRASLRLSQKVLFMEIMRKPYIKKFIIEELIQKDQLQKGMDEDGDIIGYYSEFTESINPEKRAGTPYTLKDTGDFYKSMFITVNTNYIEIDADPIKTDENGEQTNLFYKYTESIIGLTEESKEKLRQIFMDEAKTIIQKILYGIG